MNPLFLHLHVYLRLPDPKLSFCHLVLVSSQSLLLANSHSNISLALVSPSTQRDGKHLADPTLFLSLACSAFPLLSGAH
ncbi:hypothetical protein DL95DRAFT_394969, partial [Leptodontidium sp. 2 PMI_412]